jgi:hypothetical protein
MRIMSRRALLRATPVLLGTAAAGPIAAFAADDEIDPVQFHAAKLVEALEKANPGDWAVDICPRGRFVLIHRKP